VDYFTTAVAIFIAIYTYTYALWLKKSGNRLGAMGVLAILAAGIALKVYRMIGSS